MTQREKLHKRRQRRYGRYRYNEYVTKTRQNLLLRTNEARNTKKKIENPVENRKVESVRQNTKIATHFANLRQLSSSD